MGQQLLFKLDQNPNGRGLRCDAEGLFLGRDALLQRDRDGNFEARPVGELRKVLHRAYGDDANWESHVRSVKLVAAALNKGDLARAMMTAVLMRLPEPGSPISIADVDGVLEKAGFDPDEPRDEQGRWTTDGSESAAPAATNASLAEAVALARKPRDANIRNRFPVANYLRTRMSKESPATAISSGILSSQARRSRWARWEWPARTPRVGRA